MANRRRGIGAFRGDTGAEAKRALNEHFARLGKALSHPKRLELLDVLAQGECSVDQLAEVTGMGVNNTSAQLQVLRRTNSEARD